MNVRYINFSPKFIVDNFTRRYFIWFGGAIIFIIILAVLSFVFLRSGLVRPSSNNQTTKTAGPQPTPETKLEGNTVKIKSPGESSIFLQTISYKDDKFLPAKVEIKNSGGQGCFITVFNESAESLTFALKTPLAGNSSGPGPTYTVKSQEKLSLDPRFRIPKIIFYSVERPDAQFEVAIGSGCGLN